MLKLSVGRIIVCFALSLVICSTAVHAVPVLSFEVPTDYTPGTPFEVNVLLTGATDLALYDITVVLESGAGVAGSDFFFSNAVAADSQYVFGMDGFGFFSSAFGESTIQFGDFLDVAGTVSTVAGVNERLATLTVGTTALAGQLSFSITPLDLILETDNFEEITGFQNILNSPPTALVPLSASSPPNIIPTPAATAVGFVGFMLLGALRGRTGRRGALAE